MDMTTSVVLERACLNIEWIFFSLKSDLYDFNSFYSPYIARPTCYILDYVRQTDTSDLDTGFYNQLTLLIINLFGDKVQRPRVRELYKI